MKFNYFLIWLSGVDITILLYLACRALAKAGFRDDEIEDEQSWQYLLHPADQQTEETISL